MWSQRALLLAAQNHRQPLRGRGARDVVEPRELDLEHLAVEEEQRLQGLVLRGGAHLAVHREVGQELLDCGRAELTRVSAPVKADVTPHPLQISLLSAQREVARAHPLARDLEQAGHSILGRSGLAEGRHGASPDAMEPEPRVGTERQMRRVCRVSRIVRCGRQSPTVVYNLPGRCASPEAPSAAAERGTWPWSGGARRTIPTRPTTSSVSSAAATVRRLRPNSRAQRGGTAATDSRADPSRPDSRQAARPENSYGCRISGE